jgi:hypothetical protein
LRRAGAASAFKYRLSPNLQEHATIRFIFRVGSGI